jgi:hypothetical protein
VRGPEAGLGAGLGAGFGFGTGLGTEAGVGAGVAAGECGTVSAVGLGRTSALGSGGARTVVLVEVARGGRGGVGGGLQLHGGRKEGAERRSQRRRQQGAGRE